MKRFRWLTLLMLAVSGSAFAEATELSGSGILQSLADHNTSGGGGGSITVHRNGMTEAAKKLGEKFSGEALKWAVDSAAKGYELYEAYKPLSPDDKSLGVSPAGMPRIPSKCVGKDGCQGCYEKAHGDLNHLRYAFAKLDAIGTWTLNFSKKSIAFGDSASGIHGVAGLGWQPEKAKIEQSYKSFGVQYDKKYQELLGDLERSLRTIGQCEAQHFGEDDWYDRYGFMYYSFMAERYRRKE